MIVGFKSNNNTFIGSAKDEANKSLYAKDTLLENTFNTRTRANFDKFTNALTIYPTKGLKGSKNANFYEFLTMGMVPYAVGSLMLMSIFNSANKHFSHFARGKANAIGKKMALGVLFYGILKSVTKLFVTAPVKWLTGVDTELPYAKVNYELPEYKGDSDITSIEYHKVYESKDFPRWDLLYKPDKETRNEYYDNVAKKVGLGENLHDSDQEVKPIIREIAIKTDMAKMVSSYLWAAAGVCYAFQDPWLNYLNGATLKFWKPKKFLHSLKIFKQSAVASAKEFFYGPKYAKGIEKYAGKLILGLAVASSVLGVVNSVHVSNKNKNRDLIDSKRKYVVN